MKKPILLISLQLIFFSIAYGQYAIQYNRTGEQLMERILKDNITVINIELDCLPYGNSEFQQTGEGALYIDTGIILSNGHSEYLLNPEKWTAGSLMHRLPYPSKYYRRDDDINNIYRSWGTDTLLNSFHTCKLSFDMVPHTDTVKLDYVFFPSVSEAMVRDPWDALGDYLTRRWYVRPGCRPFSGIFAAFVSGGSEGYNKTNFAVIPGTNVPPNVFTTNFANMDSLKILCREGPIEGWEDIPYTEYWYEDWEAFDSTSYFYQPYFTTNRSPLNYHIEQMEVVIPVTPCDTYSVKLAVAAVTAYGEPEDFPDMPEIDWSLREEWMIFIHSKVAEYVVLNNLRGVGTVYDDCSSMGISIPETYNSINIYPNPASTSIQVDVSNVKYSSGSLVIYDILGKQVYTESLYAKKDMLQVSVKDFPSGVYTLLFHTDRGNYKGKFRVE